MNHFLSEPASFQLILHSKELFIGFCKLKKMLIFARDFAGVAQLVEHDLAKVGVAGSSPVSRSNREAV